MSHRFHLTPTPPLRQLIRQADAKLGEAIARMARADVGFAWALYEAMEIDEELERRGHVS